MADGNCCAEYAANSKFVPVDHCVKCPCVKNYPMKYCGTLFQNEFHPIVRHEVVGSFPKILKRRNKRGLTGP